MATLLHDRDEHMDRTTLTDAHRLLKKTRLNCSELFCVQQNTDLLRVAKTQHA
jgi:hypothetical protein